MKNIIPIHDLKSIEANMPTVFLGKVVRSPRGSPYSSPTPSPRLKRLRSELNSGLTVQETQIGTSIRYTGKE